MKLGTILDQSEFGGLHGGDVVAEALDRKWIEEFAEGQYVYRAPWVRVLRRLQSEILDRAYANGFEEWLFPRLIPREALDNFRLSQYAPELLVPAGSSGDQVLDPVQCISLYHLMRGRRLFPDQLPLRIVETLGGWTWRNEFSAELDGPIKAREFLRVEHVFFGTREQVRATRGEVRRTLTDLLTGWGLSWQVVAAEGCMEIPSLVQAQDDARTADEVPVQDIEVPLSSHRPDRARPGWADHFDERFDLREISGCSAEGTHQTESFRITADGHELWSGCCGIGMNRLVVAFLYRHGFDAASKELDA
ncbi:aminoacyl--tRNA ligase-related protein [Streptomyces sp. NRRL S-340]|uniref:aminoacyl--tRNA ligase-related protein n=1 Tax=Streptomyces sp. NRRL S-340 TaxID=1463901 RepID=UPI00056CDCA3|nr:aminoacyl--tRNA ligase-related protein [Streptomyces sp. NRRL S-340]